MRLRYWLSDVFQDEATDPADGASGGAVVESSPASDAISTTSTETVADSPASDVVSGQPDHAANVAFVKQWAAGDSTVTTTETTKETPVEKTSTDAVSDAGDAVASRGNEQDELLLSLAEAYDFTREELKGLSNEGLKSVLARERRLRASEISIDGDKAETTEATAATSPATASKEQAATGAPQELTFAQVAEVMTSKLLEEGYGDEAVQREVALAKQRWDREEAIPVRSGRQVCVYGPRRRLREEGRSKRDACSTCEPRKVRAVLRRDSSKDSQPLA